MKKSINTKATYRGLYRCLYLDSFLDFTQTPDTFDFLRNDYSEQDYNSRQLVDAETLNSMLLLSVCR